MDKMEVTSLEWEPIERARSNEDPSTEIVGWEASTPFGTFYTVEEYFGSDSLGWNVSHDTDEIGDSDDPNEAKEIAQADFANRVSSAVIAKALAERVAVFGPDGYLAKFIAMCNAAKAAAEKIRADELRRSAQYKRGYEDGLKAAAPKPGEPT